MVIDQEGGRPIKDLDVLLVVNTDEERLTTNEKGIFQSLKIPLGRSARMYLSDAGTHLKTVEYPDECRTKSGVAVVECAIGPTISFGEAYDALFVNCGYAACRIVDVIGGDDCSGELAVTETTVKLKEPLNAGKRVWSWRPVRPGNRPWIRYPIMEHPLSLGRSASVDVACEAVSRSAVETISSLRDVQSINSPVPTSSSGALTIHLPSNVDPDSAHTQSWASCTSIGQPLTLDILVRGSRRDVITIPFLPPGDYELTAGGGDQYFGRAPVSISSGVQTSINLASTLAMPTCALRVSCNSPTFMGRKSMCLWLLSAREALPNGMHLIAKSRPIVSENSEVLLGRFGRAPCCEIEVSQVGINGSPSAQTAHLSLARGDTEAVLSLRPYPEYRNVMMKCPIMPELWSRKALVTFDPPGLVNTVCTVTDAALCSIPVGCPVNWTVWCPGCLPVTGDVRDLPTREGAYWIEPDLKPGWGALLYFRQENGCFQALQESEDVSWLEMRDLGDVYSSQATEGVMVTDHNAINVTSDKNGKALITSAHAPELLYVHARHMHLSGITRIYPSSWAARYVVWLVAD